MFRLPKGIVSAESLEPYCVRHLITVSATEEHVILDVFFRDEEGGHWIEGEGWLSSLMSLRDDLLRGDHRMVYLAWLHAIEMECGSEGYTDELEPPVPHNLMQMGRSLQRYMDLLEIGEDIVAAAAEGSVTVQDAPVLDAEMAVSRLSDRERVEFLVKLARREKHTDLLLVKKLQELAGTRIQTDRPSKRRLVVKLVELAHRAAERREERERQEAEQARISRLEELAKREPELWDQVFASIEKKQTRAYEEAVATLRDLRDVAAYRGRLQDFEGKIEEIHSSYSRLAALGS